MNKIQIAVIACAALCLVVATGYGTYLYRLDQQKQLAEIEVHLEKGIAYFQMERFAESLDELEKIPATLNQNWRVPFYQASSLIKLKEYAPALPHLNRALALNPEEARIPFTLGIVYYKLGKLNMAKGYFAAALEIDPEYEDAKGLMGVMASLESIQPKTTDSADASADANNGK